MRAAVGDVCYICLFAYLLICLSVYYLGWPAGQGRVGKEGLVALAAIGRGLASRPGQGKVGKEGLATQSGLGRRAGLAKGGWGRKGW